MKTRIFDFIDFKRVNALLEGFNQSTGFVTAILDLDGNILSKSGWRQICTEFHRNNPETTQKCTISDTELASKMEDGEDYHCYQCINGLIDVAVPLIIKGQHIANLFSGQFFFKEPDVSFFKDQAKTYGFEEHSYLKALREVPVISEEKVRTAMNFLQNIAQLIIEMTYEKLELMELHESKKKAEEALSEKEETIRASNDFLEKIIKHTNTIFISWNPKHIITAVNNAFECLTGRNADSVIGQPLEILFPRDQVACSMNLINGILSENSPPTIELNIGNIDGTIRTVLWNSSNLYASDGISLIATFSQGQDITERKKIEEENERLKDDLEFRVKERTEQLLMANKELDSFTYSVSHDLKAPLRGIDGYSKLLFEECNDSLNDDGKDFIAKIRQSAERMNQLIEDLLLYSRLERQDWQLTEIELQQFVIAQLQYDIQNFQESGGKININLKNLKIKTNLEGLAMVFKNLVENAIKYSKYVEETEILIDYAECENKITFRVKDNGIGFDMQYHDRIFNIFERLHRMEEYPGTGIGLAIVKKVAERLNGRVWAESVIGKGSSFYFSIPKEG